MSRPIIEVENLSKRYRLGQFNAQTMREEVEQFFARLRNKRSRSGTDLFGESSDFWALKDVSFSVQPGEVVGIIGRNGAGKSTLLKILSRVTEPTSGHARIRGRIASLLEVGTGFHPELTGRENIYLNGAILGMTRAEIRAKFDEIVAFAEIDKFLDTPVKRYSSGMYVRLAFAVAAHLEPEILIVDEVLAVGDGGFQKKCLGKLGDVAKGGRTVLFVSHNMQAVISLCHRAMVLDSGRITASGTPDTIVGSYLENISKSATFNLGQTWTHPAVAPGNDLVRIKSLRILNNNGAQWRPIKQEDEIPIEVEYWKFSNETDVVINIAIYGADGSEAFESIGPVGVGVSNGPMPRGLYRSLCTIPSNLMNQGLFKIRLTILDADNVRQIYDDENVAFFEVVASTPREISWHGKFIGHVHPHLQWETTLLSDAVE